MMSLAPRFLDGWRELTPRCSRVRIGTHMHTHTHSFNFIISLKTWEIVHCETPVLKPQPRMSQGEDPRCLLAPNEVPFKFAISVGQKWADWYCNLLPRRGDFVSTVLSFRLGSYDLVLHATFGQLSGEVKFCGSGGNRHNPSTQELRTRRLGQPVCAGQP